MVPAGGEILHAADGRTGWQPPSHPRAIRSSVMAPESGDKTSNHRITTSDRILKLALGLAVILAGLAIAYSFVFTAFPQRVTFQWEFVDGRRVPISHITCPSPYEVLVHDAEPEGVVGGDLCMNPARGQVVQGIVFLLMATALGAFILSRELKLRPLPELPESVRELRRKEPHR